MDQATGERRKPRAGEPKVRTCVVTRAELPADRLIRFAADPAGSIVPDLAQKLPGRGVWVTCDKTVVDKAARAGAFARALKRQVRADPALADLVDKLMIKRLIQALSMANKAGLAVAGFEKVDRAITGGTVAALIQASDGSDDGIDKLGRRYRAMCRDADRPVHVERALTIDELSLALGRANVVHAALMMGGAAQNFLREAIRLKQYRSGSPVPADASQAGGRLTAATEE